MDEGTITTLLFSNVVFIAGNERLQAMMKIMVEERGASLCATDDRLVQYTRSTE